jgi:hypothetical protein
MIKDELILAAVKFPDDGSDRAFSFSTGMIVDGEIIPPPKVSQPGSVPGNVFYNY